MSAAVAGYCVGTVLSAISLAITCVAIQRKLLQHQGSRIIMVLAPNRKVWSFISSDVLLFLRALAMVFAITCLVVNFVTKGGPEFYTLWNFELLAFYFTVQVIIAILNRLRVFDDRKQTEFFVVNAAIILFEVVYTMVFLVDIVYWSILYNALVEQGKTDLADFTNLVFHLANIPLMTVEFLLNNVPVRPRDVLFVLNWGITYLIFAWIYESQTGDWVYDFLNINDPLSAVWILGLSVFHALIFFGVYGLYRLKMRVLNETPYFLDASSGAHKAQKENDNENEDNEERSLI